MPDQSQDDLYPDIKQQGSLGRLLRVEFKRIGSPLTATGFDESIGGSAQWASIKVNNRSSDIAVAKAERLFLAPFWIKGVRLASLKTTSTDVLARALHAWFVEYYSTQKLKSAFPDVTVSADASSYEAGPKTYIELRWAELLVRINETMPQLYPVVQRAYDTSAFRQLLPYISLDTLCFSRCTGYPFTHECPVIGPIGETIFRVISPLQEWLGEGNADEAIKIALANLPRDYGPAVHGTAETLNRA